MTLNPGDLINHERYRIDGLLNKGGMGAVYRGWDLSLEIPVAIKENLDLSPESQSQFNHEASILARLAHPNLTRVTDYFRISDQGQYLVMDYVEGEDLKSMLKRLGHLPEDQVLAWMSQIIEALDYLHSQNPPIIHRDVKPGNIKIRPDGRAMLVDFGISKVFDPEKATTTGAKAVTPGYSPPEQYGMGITDRRADIYALGATLYNLLTGKEPPDSVHRMINLSQMPSPREVNQAISPEVEQVILKSTEVVTDRRFQSVEELRAALATRPIKAETVSTEVDQGGSALNAQATQAARAAKPTIELQPELPPTEKSEQEQTFTGPPLSAGWAEPGLGNPGQAMSAEGSTAKMFPLIAILAGVLILAGCVVAGGVGAFMLSRRAPAATMTPTEAAVLVVAETSTPIPQPSDTPVSVEPTSVPSPIPSEVPPASEVSAPESYRIAGELLTAADQPVRAVAEKDGFAYVLTRKGRLFVYDLSQLEAAQDFASLATPVQELRFDNAIGLFRLKDALYVYGNAGFDVVDISQADQPKLLTSIVELRIFNMALSEDILIALGEGLMINYDVNDPMRPRSINKVISQKGVANWAGVVNEALMYVSEFVSIEDKTKGLLKVYTFQDPQEAKEIQRIDPGEVAYQLLVIENKLIRCTSNDVEVWDLGQKDYPVYDGAERVGARNCILDRGNIVANGAAYKLQNGKLFLLQTFDPNANGGGTTGQFDPLPYTSSAGGNLVLLAQPGRVLILEGEIAP